MSLNGLEAPEVKEAYQSGLSEDSGWFVSNGTTITKARLIRFVVRFLLKYSTRHEVDLFQRGSGGLLELQEAIESYEEQSPLYGFLHYETRKVVLKYVPEGTSRLLQGEIRYQFAIRHILI